VLVEHAVGDRGEAEQRERREHGAGELEQQRAAEEPSQPSPVLPGRVAEAVLDQRLLDGEIEQRLEEARRGDHEGVEAERRRRESVRGHDGGEEAEDCGGVDPGRGGRTPQEEP
jgi:hypothetical protein